MLTLDFSFFSSSSSSTLKVGNMKERNWFCRANECDMASASVRIYENVNKSKIKKTMYSNVFVASDGAGHFQRSNLNSFRVAAGTTLDGSFPVITNTRLFKYIENFAF